MSTDTREERLARRISDLYATDQQFADARPSETVAQAIEAPELRLPQIVQTVLDGYADRPALGQRAVQFVTDSASGRTSAELLPRFDTITYRELSDRVNAVAAALTQNPVRPGDRVAILGFTSIDYTTVDMALLRLGAVSVPSRPARRSPSCGPSPPRPSRWPSRRASTSSTTPSNSC